MKFEQNYPLSDQLLQSGSPLVNLHQAVRSKLFSSRVGINPLTAAAAPLLTLLGKLKKSNAYNDLERLKRHCIYEMRAFESAALQAHYSTEIVLIARTLLAALIDESITKLPWGRHMGWRQTGMLQTFNQQTNANELFFTLLARLQDTPTKHIELLELSYLCLSMGFEGKYHLQDNGREQLDLVIDELYQLIRLERQQNPRALTNHVTAQPTHARRRRVSFRLFVALSAFSLLLGFAGFRALYQISNTPLLKQIATLETL